MIQANQSGTRMRVLAGLIVAAIVTACSAQPKDAKPENVPDARLDVLRAASIGAAKWARRGDGDFVEKDDGYVQRGRKPLIVTLNDPGSESYIVSGEILLPVAGSMLRIQLGRRDRDGKASSAGGRAFVERNGKTLRMGRRLRIDSPGPDSWMPFRGIMFRGHVSVVMLGRIMGSGVLPDGLGSCAITLAKGAAVRHLKLYRLPPRFFPVLIDGKANVNVSSGQGTIAGQRPLNAKGRPKGLMQLGGVPFALPEGERANALDVSTSMSGVKEPIRLKYTYLHQRSVHSNGRLVFPVPGEQYSVLHLLAFSGNRKGMVRRTTIRIGYFGPASGILEDVVVNVPGLTERPAGKWVKACVPVQLREGGMGYLSYIRVPMGHTGNLREFKSLSLEFTRDVQVHVPVPDPFEFGMMPAGLPSDVVILGATLEISPVSVTHTTSEPGNVFFENQKAVFKVEITNRMDEPVRGTAFARCSGPGTGEEIGVDPRSWTVKENYALPPGDTKEVLLDVTPGRRGWFSCVVGVKAAGEAVQYRDTSFAILAPDTRKAGEDSPFGVWAFWTAHSVAHVGARQPDIIASLIHKGGWRWTYGGAPVASRRIKKEEAVSAYQYMKKKYNITFTLQSPPHGYQRGEGWFDEAKFKEDVVPWLKNARKRGIDHYYKVLHESRSSVHIVRRVSEFLGGTPYRMPEEEKKRLDAQFENVKKYCRAIKAADPRAKIVLINDYPAVCIEYMKRKFPSDLFDVWGSEGAMFMRQPERQPDWLCLLGQVHTWRRAQERYGYSKPLWFTEALYHGTNPGNLTLHQQGVIAVRESMLALANGVERMAAAGLIKDSSDDYRWSNWGSAGYCFREPEFNPKPSYAMYAWLTQVLDRAKYIGYVPAGCPVMHVLDFQAPGGRHIYPAWVVHGFHDVTLELGNGQPKVFDCYGNVIPVEARGNELSIQLSDTPVYITGTEVRGVIRQAPLEAKAEGGPNDT